MFSIGPAAMRFQYKHPKIYDFLIKFIYPKELMDRFSLEVGKDQSVFDVAAGYGRLAKFIDPSNSYEGIDLNKIFVRYGQKRGLQLRLKDIFEESSYRTSDVIVLADVIHHLTEVRLQKLFDLLFKFANNKIVIIEPAFVNLTAKHGIWGRLIDWFFKAMDYDGHNKIERWFTNDEYASMFRDKFGSDIGRNFILKQQKIASYYLVTFSRES